MNFTYKHLMFLLVVLVFSLQSRDLLSQDADSMSGQCQYTDSILALIGTISDKQSELRIIKLNESYSVEIKPAPTALADSSIWNNYELSIFKGKKKVYSERFDDFKTLDVYPITLKGKTGNVLISGFTGGAHCCFGHVILSLGKNVRKIADIGDNDLSLHLPLETRDIDKDGTDELVLRDWIFVYWHAGFTQSPCPEITLRYQDGHYKPSTKLMRKSYTKESRLGLWKKASEINKQVKDSNFSTEGWLNDDESSLPSELWGIMLDLLYTGNGKLALEFLDRAWYKKLKGKDVFLKTFKQQLLKSPYISAIKEMNPEFFR